MMKQEYIFPVLLIALNIGSAIFYAFSKDWRMVIYWIAAAVLNVTVTF